MESKRTIIKQTLTLNADEGRFHLNPIYDIVLKDTKKKKKDEKRVTKKLNISSEPEEGERSSTEIDRQQEN